MDRHSVDQRELWDVAESLADAARGATLEHFRKPQELSTESKRSDFDPVTIADRNSEAAMRRIIEERRPDDGILGEEFGEKPSKNGLTWVLDPIDGTRSYISGTPTWGVLIALSDADGPFLGVVDQPYIQERFCGGAGRADVVGPLGKRHLRARDTAELSDATLFTTSQKWAQLTRVLPFVGWQNK